MVSKGVSMDAQWTNSLARVAADAQFPRREDMQASTQAAFMPITAVDLDIVSPAAKHSLYVIISSLLHNNRDLHAGCRFLLAQYAVLNWEVLKSVVLPFYPSWEEEQYPSYCDLFHSTCLGAPACFAELAVLCSWLRCDAVVRSSREHDIWIRSGTAEPADERPVLYMTAEMDAEFLLDFHLMGMTGVIAPFPVAVQHVVADAIGVDAPYTADSFFACLSVAVYGHIHEHDVMRNVLADHVSLHHNTESTRVAAICGVDLPDYWMYRRAVIYLRCCGTLVDAVVASEALNRDVTVVDASMNVLVQCLVPKPDCQAISLMQLEDTFMVLRWQAPSIVHAPMCFRAEPDMTPDTSTDAVVDPSIPCNTPRLSWHLVKGTQWWDCFVIPMQRN